jgi:hypothetical protein
MTVRICIPSLFKLFGKGFLNDAYAADGNHLRWMFDQRLGFPCECFALFRSPSVSVQGQVQWPTFRESLQARVVQTVPNIVRDRCAIERSGSQLTITRDGVALDERPLIIDFHKGSIRDKEPYACWVLLSFRAGPGFGMLRGQAVYMNRGLEEVVDETPKIMKPIAGKLDVALKADRIDRIVLTAKEAYLEHVTWVRTVDRLIGKSTEGALLWELVGKYPLPTDNVAYKERNSKCYKSGVTSAEDLVKQRLLMPTATGVEPLDDPRIPPPRPPTEPELKNRYFDPWKTFEPWISGMLDYSDGGRRHQMEYSLEEALDEAGQTFNDGVPEALAGGTMDVCPYTILLMASLTFPFARVLGLAEVDKPPSATVQRWDYMVVGGWSKEDIASWPGKLLRELRELQAKVESATPVEKKELVFKMMELKREWNEAKAIVNALLNAARGDEYVHLAAIKIGVEAREQSMFQSPSVLNASDSGYPVSPLDHKGVTLLKWPLRLRSRRPNKTLINETIPMGAIVVRRRGPAGGPVDVLNPFDPHSSNRCRMLLVPERKKDTSGNDVATFLDRNAAEGVEYTYGVSEVDPFGRWSPFTETTFMWKYDIAPPIPTQMRATLACDGGTSLGATIELCFRWQSNPYAPDRHGFDIHLSRVAPGPEDPSNRSYWGRCERRAGTAAPPFHFLGSFAGGQTHDGMKVTVSSKDQHVTDALGAIYDYRDFTVRFEGVELALDAVDRAQVWVGVSTRDEATGRLSDNVGGPAKAECYIETPPVLPALPHETEKAAYCDAQGISTYTLHWNRADSQRYVVFRAGESELVLHLQNCGIDTNAYDSAITQEDRAEALKLLATNHEARQVFQPRSGIIPDPPRDSSGAYLQPKDWENAALGPVAGDGLVFTDTLPGLLRTLTIYTVLGRSKAGIMSDWPESPESFVVVEVPIAREPTQPIIYGAVWKPPQPGEVGNGFIELQIVEPPKRIDESGNSIQQGTQVGSYEIYRTTDEAKTHDYYFMRRLGSIDSPVYAPRLLSDPAYGSINVTTFLDRNIASWTTYYYRVVARAQNIDSSRSGTRSIASSPVRVEALSGSAPTPSDVVAQHTAEGKISVSFTAKLPKTSAGEFLIDVISVDDTAPEGAARTVIKRITATAAQKSSQDVYVIEVDSVLMSKKNDKNITNIIIRVKDPLGHSSESAPAPVA